eukprot:CAMPEP_0114232526 /NCGR_PEP_ID=MMETSP0058-20121206/4655_1 /TAXON_ID=36894 /ORGANISM="Pyramimonas parkeae, CCMP726" /LENGTH=176 /DNA_ID=CAMNT_0001344009 /DNA_START=1125 /DNA_END=1658 /DNA_ORIENTATION=-
MSAQLDDNPLHSVFIVESFKHRAHTLQQYAMYHPPPLTLQATGTSCEPSPIDRMPYSPVDAARSAGLATKSPITGDSSFRQALPPGTDRRPDTDEERPDGIAATCLRTMGSHAATPPLRDSPLPAALVSATSRSSRAGEGGGAATSIAIQLGTKNEINTDTLLTTTDKSGTHTDNA